MLLVQNLGCIYSIFCITNIRAYLDIETDPFGVFSASRQIFCLRKGILSFLGVIISSGDCGSMLTLMSRKGASGMSGKGFI